MISTTPQDQPLALFMRAIQLGRAELLAEAIAEGLDLAELHPKRGAAVCLAAQANDDATLRALLEAGFDPNGASNLKTPLSTAVRLRYTQILKTLLVFGANPNAGAVTDAPIWPAASQGPDPLLPILLAAGASIDVRDRKGRTPLHIAVQYGNLTNVQILLRAKAAVDARAKEGKTALHMAACFYTPPIYQLLVDHGADVSARSDDGRTPALWAAARGQTMVFDFLVRSGADPLARDAGGRSALDLAIENGADHMAMHLLQNHPDLSPAPEALDGLFVEAVRHNCPKMVATLAEMGADLGQKPGGRSLLQCAPSNAEDVKRLLRALKSSSEISSAMTDDGERPGPTAMSMTL